MRRLQIKFPSQIRISGWDFGSSARAMNQAGGKDALMTYENESAQADLVKVTRSTTERKTMSTKTTIKRIALVAVSALGLGVLTSVAPASAADNVNITAISAGSSSPARVNVSSGSTTITVTHPAGSTNETVTAQIVAAPATSTAAALTFSSPTTGGPAGSPSYTASTKTDQNYAGNAGVAMAVFQVRGSSATTTKLTLKLTADVAGSYQILVTANAASAAGYSAGKISTNYTIATSGVPTVITVSKYAGTVSSYGTNGALYAVTLKDANGVATVLGQNESIDFSDTDSTTTLKNLANDTTISSFGSASSGAIAGPSSGTYYVRVVGNSSTVDGTDVLTFTGSGLVSNTVTTNVSVATVTTTAAPSSGVSVTCTTSTNCVAATDFDVPGSVGLTIGGLTGSTSADVVHSYEITDKAGIAYSSTLTIAKATTAATSTTISSPSVDSTYTTASIAIGAGASGAKTFDYATATLTGISIQGTASVLSATGAKNTFVAKAVDQFSRALPYQAVSIAVSGRNTVVSTSIGVTDANGLISYSLTDAGTTGVKDTITFTAGAYSATAYVNYGTVTVSTVTVSGGSKAETVAGSTLTAISAADNGPESSAVAIKAIVKDASGNLLAGVPVTFTVDKGAIKKTAAIDYAVVYTGTDGAATTYVFDWVAETQTITATAGGKSGTDYLTWAATDASSARVLSASVNGNIVSVKVVDRFGNGVKGVTVDLARQGSGFFGTGKSTDSVVTDKYGTADIQFNGTAVVTASLAATYTQAADIAGQIDETAVTAAVAGTTKGTGASLAPAGVNKVSVDVSDTSSNATDAANEATDAANAATDAANAAAEAADAATAAAQDAQAAVAALATQVASLIAGIKAQITTLTNLVIKIQKKVRA